MSKYNAEVLPRGHAGSGGSNICYVIFLRKYDYAIKVGFAWTERGAVRRAKRMINRARRKDHVQIIT